MVKLLRALAAFETPLLEEENAQRYALEHDSSRYFADQSLEGGAELDWNSQSERVAMPLLEQLVDPDIEVRDDGEARIAQTLGDCAYGTAANRNRNVSTASVTAST